MDGWLAMMFATGSGSDRGIAMAETDEGKVRAGEIVIVPQR